MHKIVPHLWFDKEAMEAAKFYSSLFPDSKITNIATLHNTPSGDCDIVSFELSGQPFMAISAGPFFKINPSISFILNFDPSKDKDARKHLDALWEKLSKGGTALMPLQKYPFSEHYGWISDKYGVSWQLMLTNPEGDERPFITPFLMFVGPVCGKAEEASDFYISVFKNSKRGVIVRHPKGMEPDREGTIMFTDFMLEKQWFAAMDSAHGHKFAFNEAVSFIVYCDDQKEIDYYWKKLSAVPEAEQCGWLKDKYGVSWQIVPRAMDEMMRKGTEEQIARLSEAFLKLKKFDIAAMKKAYGGKNEKNRCKHIHYSRRRDAGSRRAGRGPNRGLQVWRMVCQLLG
jgi:predicted 3-demethylubiquinone-9 3-methyltransferase (glyoxalase superfamily)